MKKTFVFILLIVIILVGFFLYYQKGKLTLLSVLNKEKLFQQKGQSLEKETESSKTTVVGEKTTEVNQGLVLEIISPKDKETVASSPITISGKTASYAEVFVNEMQTKANASGDFSLTYEVLEGENEIYVVANDEEGNYAEKMITVYLETTE